MSQPLWYNTNILIDRKTVYLDLWDKKGIWLVNDLFDENGNFYEYKKFCEMYELSPLITEFYGVRNSVLKLFEKPCFERNKIKLLYPYIPQYISIFLSKEKGTEGIYDLFIDQCNFKPKSEFKWENNLKFNVSELWWKNAYYFTVQFLSDVKLRWLQFRIIHRIIVTNQYLFNTGLKDSQLCTFCHTLPETIIHLYWECDKVKHFWNCTETWIMLYTNNIEKFITERTVFFGIHDKSAYVLNLILCLGKYHIYRQRLNSNVPMVNIFKKEIQNYFAKEKFISLSDENYKNNFNLRWSKFQNLVIDSQ